MARALLRSLLLATAAAFASFGYDFTSLVAQGYVSDFTKDKVIDAASRAELERYSAAVERSTGVQMAFVAIDSLEGEPIEDVANAIFRKWGIGSKKNNEGILLLLSVGDRRHRLEVGYGLEPILPDGFDGSVLRAMRPQLRAGNYGEALLDAAHTIGSRIAQAMGVDIQVTGGVRRRSAPQSSSQIPWGAIFVGIVILLVLMNSSRGGGGGGGFLTGMILGNLMRGGMGRGGGGWGGASGGGGFGGYDSGDGFGGFGGGDSGGGGASSDW